MPRDEQSWRPRTHHNYTLPIAAAVLLAIAAPALAITQRTITVDGSMSDWGDILVDPENAMADGADDLGDLDSPTIISADRDGRGFAFTWDSTNFYYWARRTTSGSSQWYLTIYLDVDFDGLLETTDRILNMKFNGSSFHSGNLYAYSPAAPGGDAITGDGVPEPGIRGANLGAMGILAAGNPTGIEIEGLIPWGATGLNLPPASPMNFHVSVGPNENYPGGVEDNFGRFETVTPRPIIVTDHWRSTAPGTLVNFGHTVTNGSNATDTLDLICRSSQGWAITLYTDPNGDGDPADGAFVARDSNGDGDYVDGFDTPPSPAFDSDGDGQPDGGALAAGASRSYVVQLEAPFWAAPGSVDTMTVTVRSSFDLSKTASNTNVTEVGFLTAQFDDSQRLAAASASQDTTAYHPNSITNNTGSAMTVTLSTTSSLGWATALYTDPNGDGDPSDGVLITGPFTLPAGSTLNIVVVVTVPAATADGTQNVTTLTATDGTFSDTALDTLTIAPRLDLSPDNVQYAVAGQVMFFPHVITNAAQFRDTYTMSAFSTLGSTVSFMTDPNGNGIPDDSVPYRPQVGTTTRGVVANVATIGTAVPHGLSLGDPVSVRNMTDPTYDGDFTVTGVPSATAFSYSLVHTPEATTSDTSGTVLSNFTAAAGGGTFRLLARVVIPVSALAPTVDVVTVTATAATAPAVSDSATDTTNIGLLATYSDPLLARPAQTFFSACARVYAKAHGLDTNKDYRFKWYAPGNPVAVRTSPYVGPDADTNADDSYELNPADPSGIYTVELWKKEGSGETLVTTATFTSLAPGTSDLVGLATDRAGYGIPDTVRVTVTASNPTPADNLDTSIEYTIFFDADGSNTPTAGDTYVLANASTAAWSPGGNTHVTTNVDVFANTSFSDFWQVGPVNFPAGMTTWKVLARWLAPCQVEFDRQLVTFTVCFAPPTADAGPDQTICLGNSTTIGTPALAGHTYLWNPALGLDNRNLAQPTASPTVSTTYTVLVTGPNGCTALDAMTLTVDPSPTPGPMGNVVMGEKSLPTTNRYTWPAIPDAQTYNVYRGTVPTSLTLLGNTTNLWWDDTVLTDGIDYYYNVRAKACNEGP